MPFPPLAAAARARKCVVAVDVRRVIAASTAHSMCRLVAVLALLSTVDSHCHLEVVVVWVSIFAIIEFVNRFRLGKIRWNGGTALDKIVGFSAVLTGPQITEMKSNSSQIMAGLRLAVHCFTLVWLCILLTLSSGLLPETSTISSNWGRPTLCLTSLYGLIVFSELW